MTTGAFNHAGSDGPASFEVNVIGHIGQVALEISGRFFQLGALSGGIVLILSHLLKRGNDLLGLTGQDFQGVVGHPVQSLGMLFPQQDVDYSPQILIGVNEIQDQAKIGELVADPGL